MIIGITFLSFLLSYLSPGDPAQILLNNQGVKASEEALQSTRHELGLDRPMIVQYGDWLMDLCKGDMGRILILAARCSVRFAGSVRPAAGAATLLRTPPRTSVSAPSLKS